MTDRAQAICAGLVLVLAFAAGWTVNGWRAEARIASLESSQSKESETKSQQAQEATKKKSLVVIEHGASQQENTHDYTQELARLEAGRAADAVRIAGLQQDIRSVATRNAQLAGDAAACRGLADQHQRLAALAAEGAELVSEAGGLVARRDAQVALLLGQVATDRKLLERERQE